MNNPMNTEKIMQLDDEHSIAGFKKRKLAIVRGSGAVLWDSKGKEYIDCVGGQGVACAGHCPPAVTERIKKQLDELIICPALFYNDTTAELKKRLADLSGLSRVFFCNSGTEAVEGAFKFARVSTGKKEIIAAMRGFHGRTFGALSATWKKPYREPFEPLVPGFKYVPYNNFEKLRDAVSDDTAAIILEVVQGEGGVIPVKVEYLKQVRALCSEQGIILIFDEVQTGFGRTGKMFACEHHGVLPDIMTVAKAIAAGMPMGAILCNKKIQVPDKVHANTFGGYPLVCEAALATLDYFEKEKLIERSMETGAYFMSELQKIESDKIREVRGMGLMIAVELKEKAGSYICALMDKGVLALLTGINVIRFLPPLVISKEQVDVVVGALKEVL